MSDYQKLILDRISGSINEWLEALKQKQPELLLTRQWRIVWLKGFKQGQNIIPVITSCKDGEYLIAQIQIVLPPSLELDLSAVELVLKEEPYVGANGTASVPSIDDPLDLLNNLVVGINGFLTGMPIQPIGALDTEQLSPFAPLKVFPMNGHSKVFSENNVELKDKILKSPHLPEWFKTIESRNVAQEVLNKLAEGYTQYSLRKGHTASLSEYFEDYTAELLKQSRLHHHCPYKGRGVELDFYGQCKEPFCSKKPHSSPCTIPNIRFGALDTS